MNPSSIQFLTNGVTLEKAQKAAIFLHGRGATADNILALSSNWPLEHVYCVAPSAPHNTWYPYSFMADLEENEPFLSNSLDTVGVMVDLILNAGLDFKDIYFVGFSQGACLALEFVARNATQYGGVIALSGGLIGPQIDMGLYTGDLNNTPIFIGSSNPDAHVPVQRVTDSGHVLKSIGADIKVEIYEYMGHTTTKEECEAAGNFVFKGIR